MAKLSIAPKPQSKYAAPSRKEKAKAEAALSALLRQITAVPTTTDHRLRSGSSMAETATHESNDGHITQSAAAGSQTSLITGIDSSATDEAVISAITSILLDYPALLNTPHSVSITAQETLLTAACKTGRHSVAALLLSNKDINLTIAIPPGLTQGTLALTNTLAIYKTKEFKESTADIDRLKRHADTIEELLNAGLDLSTSLLRGSVKTAIEQAIERISSILASERLTPTTTSAYEEIKTKLNTLITPTNTTTCCEAITAFFSRLCCCTPDTSSASPH